MTPKPDNGIVTIPSHYSVDETVKRIEETLAAKDVKLFALIDHSAEAEKAGLQMRPTKLLIFGNPKAGTPWMLATPSIAIDLPMKISWRKTLTVKSGSRTMIPPTFRQGITYLRNSSGHTPPPV